MDEPTIRPGQVADLERLPEIERDAAQRFHDIGYGFAADGPVRDVDEHMRALRTGVALVAETNDGGTVGFALVLRLDGRAHLMELSVACRHQGKGTGRALSGEAEAWAIRQGLSEITLTTFRDVPWNAPFYRRLGYQEFSPGMDRPGLRAVIDEEREAGFHQRPRVAMHKYLDAEAT